MVEGSDIRMLALVLAICLLPIMAFLGFIWAELAEMNSGEAKVKPIRKPLEPKRRKAQVL